MAKKGVALKPASEQLTARPSLRCKPAELKAWKKAAKAAKKTLSDYVRDVVNQTSAGG